jgi:anti-sigma-K factor RskA
MNTANHISEDDLALFALQFMPEEDLKTAVEHMQHCEACRNRVGQYQGDLVSYAMTAEMHSPPAAARERLMRKVAKEKKLIPIDRSQPHAEPVLAARSNSLLFEEPVESQPRRSSGVLAWTGWAIAAGALVAGGLQFHQRQLLQNQLAVQSAKLTQTSADFAKAQSAMAAITDPNAFQVAMHAPVEAGTTAPKKVPEAHTAYDADKGALVFVATNLDPLPAYKTYELWVIPVDGVPIPAGTFKPDANASASVVMPDIPKGITAKAFGVTIEDEGGSKSPTTPIVLAGA